METTKFIFKIDTEKHYNILVRIITVFNRQRIPILEFSSHIIQSEDHLRVHIAFEQNKKNALMLSKRLNKEVDINKIQVFEQV
jgi:hypothetical protein